MPSSTNSATSPAVARFGPFSTRSSSSSVRSGLSPKRSTGGGSVSVARSGWAASVRLPEGVGGVEVEGRAFVMGGIVLSPPHRLTAWAAC